MAKALSTDLRRRVVDATAQGMSCRQAAERFGVSASSAIRWQQRVRTTGTIEPRTQGGDRRSKRIEAHSQVILGLVAETPDITLVGIRAKLADRGGVWDAENLLCPIPISTGDHPTCRLAVFPVSPQLSRC